MESSPIEPAGNRARIHTWVVPGSSRSTIVGLHGDKLKLKVASPPESGRANEEAMELLKDALGVSVELIKGITSRHKVFEVAEGDVESLHRKLGLID